MKKILIVNSNLDIGGVQKSLLNLLKEVKDEYDITLLLFKSKIEYSELIPPNIRVITIVSPFRQFGFTKAEIRNKPLKFISRCFWVTICKILGRAFTTKCMGVFQRKLKGYDIAISFLHEHPQKSFYGGCNEFVLRHVKAKEKIAWIHCDIRNNGANNKSTRKVYQQFDKIVACSESTKNAFLECFPQFRDKTFFMRNCNDYSNIARLAATPVTYGNSSFNIVTVARLAQEKGIDRALRAVKYCIERGLLLKYHIIGGGKERVALENLVCSLGLENEVVFYGEQQNPYKYIKNADLMLLTSYHEAAPMIFDETAFLQVPILTTNTTSAYEMVGIKKYGILCENEQEAISKMLFEVCSNQNVLKNIKASLCQNHFNNQLAMGQFHEIMKRGG